MYRKLYIQLSNRKWYVFFFGLNSPDATIVTTFKELANAEKYCRTHAKHYELLNDIIPLQF